MTRYKLRDTYDAPAECPTGASTDIGSAGSLVQENKKGPRRSRQRVLLLISLPLSSILARLPAHWV